MIIKKISIKKFRGFEDSEFRLGSSLTVIAGQNGTQKTTLLGLLSQPFSITNKQHPLYGEKPLCGGNFRSAFAEKFKLSNKFDKAKSHEWTLYFYNKEPFTVESIKRAPSESNIRFWKKGDRSKGSGYIQMPVIYLSLSRLFPIGEDDDLNTSDEVKLTAEEFEFYEKWHNKILCIPDIKMTEANYLASKQKNTIGANTNFYDWRMNSAGQDNIGKILLAILSFKRLKNKGGGGYSGGILVIDELDATLYPASQLELLKALRRFASRINLQIIFTTHSLNILKESYSLSDNPKFKDQVNIIYLERLDNKIIPREDLSYKSISRRLNVLAGKQAQYRKIITFVEDKEGEIFVKALLKTSKCTKLKFIKQSLGCKELIGLSRQKVPAFNFPDSLIFLDGDVSKKGIVKLKNILIMPGMNSPEQLLAKFLYELKDSHLLWGSLAEDYSKQVAFREYTLEEILHDREKSKKWFRSQQQYWGRGCAKLINAWIKENKKEVEEFRLEFDAKIKEYEKYLGTIFG